jgi:hypothetical protein
MKLFLIAGAIALSATAVSAEGIPSKPLSIDGDIVYSVENKNFSIEAGPTMTVGAIKVAPRVASTLATDGMKFALTGVSVKGTYDLSSSLNVYSKLSMTKKLKYSDLTVGIGFSF